MNEIPLGVLFAVLIACFCLSAFFSGSETALMALNRYRLQHKAERGQRAAVLTQRLLERPDRLIGLILIGNNLANILVTQLATYIGYRMYGDAGIALATGLLTLAILVFGEVTPKTIGAMHSERFAFPAAFIYTPLMVLAWPLVQLINLIANFLLRGLGVPVNENGEGMALSREELRSVVNQTGSLIPRKHRRMLLGILDLEKATVEDIMIPRHEIAGLDLDDDWEDIVRQLKSTAYTRLPVFHGDIDNVVGFVHMRRVLHLIIDRRLTRQTLENVIREAYFIPENTSLNRQLLSFQHERRRMGLVVDEYGDIQGLVTLEDLLEEIVGEFTTDPSAVSREITPQEDGSVLVDGGTQVRELNRVLGWQLDTSGPKTVNGLILEHLETIPESGTSVLIDGHPVEILQTKNNGVKTVSMSPQLQRRVSKTPLEG